MNSKLDLIYFKVHLEKKTKIENYFNIKIAGI